MTVTEDDSTGGEAPTPTGRAAQRIPAEVRAASTGRGDARRATHRWARWLHVYASMTALVVVLFFGITGITLNHPTWTFGDEAQTTETSGVLPFSPTLDDGSVDFLSVSEFVRAEYGVAGGVDSFDVVNGVGSIAYKNAGYAADLFFDVETGAFDLSVEQQGWVAVMNDLHKGRDTGTSWKWLIDVSAGFLVLVSLTGLVMQFFLRKRRRSALVSVAVGGAVVIALVWLTLR